MTDTAPITTTINPWLQPFAGGHAPPHTERLVRALEAHAAASAGNSEIAVGVRGLIRNEHEGSRHLRHLARQEPTLYGGLYPLLLETIARDSEKHATILRYLLHHIEERTR